MSWRFTVCMGHGRGINDNGEPITVSLASGDGGKIYECGPIGGTWRGFLDMLGEPPSVYGLSRVADGIWASNAFPGDCPRTWEEVMLRFYPSRYPWMTATPSPEPTPDDDNDVQDVYPHDATFGVKTCPTGKGYVVYCTNYRDIGDLSFHVSIENAGVEVSRLTRLHADKVIDAAR